MNPDLAPQTISKLYSAIAATNYWIQYLPHFYVMKISNYQGLTLASQTTKVIAKRQKLA